MASKPNDEPKQRASRAKPTDYIVLVEDCLEDDNTGRDIVWRPVVEKGRPRIFPAFGPNAAIEQYTGKVHDAKARTGRFKAVAWSAWKGVLTIREPVQVAQQSIVFAEE